MEFLFQHFKIVSIDDLEVLNSYAAIDSQAAREGRPLGKNDAWIAATATATGAILLTTDRDFDQVPSSLLSRVCISVNEAGGRPT